MASAMLQPLRTSKRKRVEVNYYESDSDEDDLISAPEFVDFELEACLSKKKPKAIKKKTDFNKPLPKHKIFPFDLLPAELKNGIYDIALRDHNGVYLSSRTKHFRRTVQRDSPSFTNSCSTSVQRRKRVSLYGSPPTTDDSSGKPETASLPLMAPGILLLNRAIYAQAQPILYASNEFIVEDTSALHAFLATIGPKNCATLTNLTVKGWGYTKAHKAMNYPAFTMLSNAVNLQRLHMDCRVHWGGGPVGVARQFYRESFHYLDAVGVAKGRSDAALDILEMLPENFETYRYYGSNVTKKPSDEENMEDFRAELRKLMRI